MKNFYNYKGLLLVVVGLFFLSTQQARASHIPGANITATCNPSNPLEYTFTLTVFRRCPGTHPTTMGGNLFTITNNCGLTNPIVPTFQQVGVAVDVNQLCSSVTSNCSGGSQPGVWLYTYEATVTLPANCDGWNMAYSLCCRDASSNMSGGSGNTMYTSTTINTLTAPCNTTPRVTSAPIPYACTNTPFTYCLTTSDAEGDSVSYRMVAPSNTGGAAITHLAGFSVASPLTGFVLNPITGCFSFNEPNVGNYVVAIAIDEYDGAGNVISTVIHDFQVQVINCTNTPPNNPVGSITNVTGTANQTGANSISACIGQTFCFDVTFSDVVDVNDSVFISTNGLALFPGATFTTTGINPVVGTFCWNVVPGSLGGSVTFQGFDNGCPVRGTNSFGVAIDIIDGVYAGPDASVCGGTPVQLNATGGTVFNWSPATGLSCTNCPNPVASPSVTTTYYVTGNLSGSCSNMDSVVVNVENVPPTASISGNVGICGTGSNTLTATGGSRFLWSTGATTASINVSPSVSTTYSVIVTNFVGGCEAYDTVDVVVSPTVTSNIPDQIICNGNSATISASGGGGYAWSTGETTPDITVSPTTMTDYFVTITLGNCSVVDTINIDITPTSAPVMTCRGDTTLPPCTTVYDFVPPTALDYCAASPCVSSPIADVLAALNTNGTSIAGNIPNGYNMSDGITGTCVNDGGNDMYDCGNQLNTSASTLIPYTGGNINTHPGFNGANYFTHKFNNLWVMVADLNGVTSFFTTGNNGADGSGNVDGFTYTVTVGCMNYYVFVKRINAAGDPSINHIYIVPDNGTLPAPTHTFATNTNDDLHTLSNLGNFDRLYYLLLAGNAGYAYTNAEIEAAVLDFINQANVNTGGVAQAPVTQITGPASGSILPVGTTTFTFQANGVGGTTTCSYDVIVPPAGVPVITCRTDTTVSECNSVVTFANPIASDPCNAPCGNPALAAVLADFNTNGASIASSIPSGYNMTDGVTGTCVLDGGNDMYDCGNQLNTNLGTLISYTGGTVTANANFGTGSSYFTRKINNLWVMVADLNGINTFFTTGNNGADGGGNVNGFTYTVTVGCQSYYVFVKRINGAGSDPSINQVFIVPDNGTLPAPTHTFATNTNDGGHTLNNLANFERLYYLLLAGTSGIAYTNAQIQTTVVDFLTQVNASAGIVGGGVTVAQIAGLPSGSTFPVGTNTVTYRATSNTTGQTADCSFDIIVQPRPTAAITGNTVVCAGGSTTLTASGGGTYLWSTGATTANITVSPLVATDYIVTVTDNLNCEGQDTISTTIGIASTPPILAPIAGSICPNSTLTLTAAGGTAAAGSSIQWYTGPNGTGTWMGTGGSLPVSPTTTTTYYVRREGGCNITGDDQVTVNLKDYIYALNAATTSTYCTDNAGWHHFYSGNEIILSIRGDLTGAPAGFPQITINDNGTYYQQTQGPFTPASCANGFTPGEERFEMERSWNVDFGGGTLIPPYEVRFYYQPAERTAVENAALAHMGTYPACGYSYKYAFPQGSYFFKNVGSQYTAPDFDGLQMPTVPGTTPNGVNYTEMSGITSFSGGSLGLILIPNTLLPVDWLYFRGTTDNTTNKLNWATASEQNTDYFRVQRSADGMAFETIGVVQAQGQSSSAKHYTYDDNNPFEGQNYYRLELVDQNGDTEQSKTILLNIRVDGKPYLFYPNPTTGVVYYQYESQKAEVLQLEVLDVLGKRVRTQQLQGTTGINNIPVDLEDLPVGTYMIRIYNETRGTVHTEKITKRKP
ncbi:MAG: T9SS type A sorting domain-containing protein [Aureispira sp.]